MSIFNLSVDALNACEKIAFDCHLLTTIRERGFIGSCRSLCINMKDSIPTCGQLERTLSQKIRAFYRDRLGHQPSKVTCQLFEQKLAIIIEDSITPAEELLATKGNEKLAEQVHSSLEEALKPQLKDLIKEILDVEVVDLLSDATLETGRTGIIAVLTDFPQVRNPEVMPKAKNKSSS